MKQNETITDIVCEMSQNANSYSREFREYAARVQAAERRLRNELESVKRENAMYHRRFEPLLRRGFVAVAACHKRREDIVETFAMSYPCDDVRMCNLLKHVKDGIDDWLKRVAKNSYEADKQ